MMLDTFQSFENLSDPADIGEITRAVVDGEITILFGTKGVVRMPHQRNGITLPDLAPLTVGERGIINAGATMAKQVDPYDVAIAQDEQDDEDEPAGEERFTFAQIEAMMRHKVPGGAHGGGGGGGMYGRKSKGGRVEPGTAFGMSDGNGGPGTARGPRSVDAYQIGGLTVGEEYFYHNRRDLALRFAKELVGVIVRDQYDERALRAALAKYAQAQRLRYNFELCGLSDPERTIIRTYSGSIRLWLAYQARLAAGERIAKVDAGEKRVVA